MNDDEIQPLTLTVEQAAKVLGIGRSTAYELVHTGEIPSLRLGRRIVVPAARVAMSLGVGSEEIGRYVAQAYESFPSLLPGPLSSGVSDEVALRKLHRVGQDERDRRNAS
jgi:excisionase family DNA binding protein